MGSMQAIVSFFYVAGSGLFVVGSILFLPGMVLSYVAAPIFVAGSCCFLLATITEPILTWGNRHIWRPMVESYRQGKDPGGLLGLLLKQDSGGVSGSIDREHASLKSTASDYNNPYAAVDLDENSYI